MENKEKFTEMITAKDVHDLLKNFFSNDQDIAEWLNTPNANFGNTTPQHLINNGRANYILLWLEASLEGH